MSTTATPSSTGRLGFALLLGLLALAAGGKAILADTLDPDCFWHLRVADQIAKAGWPRPLVDDLSFESSKQPWTPYSWLAELGMKRLWDAGGYRAAVAVQALMQAAFIIMLGLGAVEASRAIAGTPRYLASALAAAAGGLLSLAYLSFRPVTADLVLMSLIAWLLLRDRRMNQNSVAVWLVPLLTLFAANVHFIALLVPLWTASLLVGDAIELRPLRRGLLLTALTAAASLATPMPFSTLRTVAGYAFHDVMVRSHVIAEMQPFYRDIMGHVSAAIVTIISVCVIVRWFAAWRGKGQIPLPLGELIWLAGSAVLLFAVGRMSPVFALIGCPLLAATMPNLSDRTLTRPAIVIALAAVLVIGICKLVLAFPASSTPLSVWLNRNLPFYPCAAADYVDQHVSPASHRIICEFSWGGYLEWRLGDRFQMMMDGRTQVFPAQFWQLLFLGSAQDRRRMVQDARADAAIVPAQRSAFLATLLDLNWKTVYEDACAKVLIPPPAR
ncbi:MAG: hypothetical protein ABR964_02005 [Tepidisphaeraceae bacterium]|jgi:hypothetical protein